MSKLKHYLHVISLLIKNRFLSKKQYDLVIVDDIFPQSISGFRMAEYMHYLKYMSCIIYSTGFAFKYVREKRALSEVIHDFNFAHPELRGKVMQFNHRYILKAKLGYVMFLHNADYFLSWFEKNRLPFIFMLYPGGGFKLNNVESDEKLNRICISPLLKKVIVSQKTTLDYLLDCEFIAPDKIELVYGVVTPVEQLVSKRKRTFYKQQKNTFDICFVGMKYTEKGIDKGYDLFIETAKKLCEQFCDIRFHVVGTFTPDDIDVSIIKEYITFYGTQPTSFFTDFYMDIDAIISPNRPFVLDSGAFDGFPTGACVEAGLLGVAVFCSDSIKQNMLFESGRELVLVDNSVESIEAALLYYYKHYEELTLLASRGQEAYHKTFGPRGQLLPRMEIIQHILDELN